jgi:hypothetical protein
MNDSELKKLFPVEIDLCKTREVTDYSKEMSGAKGKPPTKKVTDCPTLYIRGIDGLDKLPKDGYILIEIHRSELKVIDRDPSKDSSSSMYIGDDGKPGVTMDAELEVHSICLPAADAEETESEDRDKEDFGDAMDRTAEKMGLKSKSTAPSGDDVAGDEE